MHGYEDAGAMNVIYGSEEGLTGLNNQFISRKDLGLPMSENEQFAWAIVSLRD